MKLKHLMHLDESPLVKFCNYLNLEAWTLYSDLVRDLQMFHKCLLLSFPCPCPCPFPHFIFPPCFPSLLSSGPSSLTGIFLHPIHVLSNLVVTPERCLKNFCNIIPCSKTFNDHPLCIESWSITESYWSCANCFHHPLSPSLHLIFTTILWGISNILILYPGKFGKVI